MMRVSFSPAIVLFLGAISLGVTDSFSWDDRQTLDELRKEAAESQPSKAQSSKKLSQSAQTAAVQSSVRCPDPVALDLFRHQIAYQRTEGSDPFRSVPLIHADVWVQDHATAFYVREPPSGSIPTIRMVYPFAEAGMRGVYTCQAEQNWRECVEQNISSDVTDGEPHTCTVTVDVRNIPAWAPSPNDRTKLQVAKELGREIEAKWQEAQEIVVRDFNLKDSQITIYLKMRDGDYFQGCGFRARAEPHCVGWHLFGQAPYSSLRKWVFERPYRLK